MGIIPKDKDVLQRLADQSPQGFVWAKSFIDAQAKSPRLGLEDFLKEKNIPYTEYIGELQKSGRGPGDVLEAMRHEPALTSNMASKIKVADRAPSMPKAATNGEEALAKLAREDPKSYAIMKSYIDEKNAKPGTQLGDFLKKSGVDEGDFINRVAKASGSSSGELLKTMAKSADFVEGLTKFVSHSKLGKVITAGGVLFGALTGAHAKGIKEAGKDFAIAFAGAADPMAQAGPSILQHAVSKAIAPERRTEFDEAGIDTSKISGKAGILKAMELNGRIDREQKFLLGADHPGQLGALKFKDASGQTVDVAASLKDPARRGIVLAEIDRREAGAGTGQMKQLYADMKESAVTYAAMEDRRKPLPADIVMVQPQSQPQSQPPQSQPATQKPAAVQLA